MIERDREFSICDRPTFDRRIAWLLKFAIVTLALLSLPTAGEAADPPDVKAALRGGWSWDLDWTVADFDGDRVPDVAKAEIEGQTDSDTLYRVTLHLSGEPGSAFDIRLSERPQLQISARDIDGDHNPDLVITAGALRQPVGIWLNDGKGSFTQTDASAYSDGVWQDPPTASERNAREESLGANAVQARFPAPSLKDQISEITARRIGRVEPKRVTVACIFLAWQSQVRPPPSEFPRTV